MEFALEQLYHTLLVFLFHQTSADCVDLVLPDLTVERVNWTVRVVSAVIVDLVI